MGFGLTQISDRGEKLALSYQKPSPNTSFFSSSPNGASGERNTHVKAFGSSVGSAYGGFGRSRDHSPQDYGTTGLQYYGAQSLWRRSVVRGPVVSSQECVVGGALVVRFWLKGMNFANPIRTLATKVPNHGASYMLPTTTIPEGIIRWTS